MTDSPVSLYAATKKANELMAYAYADTSRLKKDFNYQAAKSIETGINSFYLWFTEFYNE